ncbi:MAG: hypothetical protein K5705_05290 [Oscillospiraceae bacterium]|nr:hypothetical protein [Oscillospiraceae bacterium]
MKRTRKRALSLTLSVMMTASLLPSYLTQLPIPARANDPPASDYTPDTDPTIDFDYANTHNIMNADDALRDLAANGKNCTSTNKAEEMYRKFPWRHASGISCNAATDTDDSVRALLESTNPNNKYVVLAKNATISQDYWKGHKWEPIKITKDKVLDLSGRQIRVDYDANINHSDDQPSQEYRWKEAHYQTMFEIEDGATLTIIDSNEWRASGSNGMISFKADWCDHFSYDYKWYGHRDLFHVKNGNLIIYGGIYDAGLTKVQTKEVSNFTWEKLQTAIGTAVELGVNIAKYATGISTADAAYKDVLKDVADMESGKANPSEPKPGEAQKSQPDGKTSGRNQSVSEKAASKDAQIAAGNKTGTPEGENKTDSDGKAKNDSNTKVANAKNEIVNQVIDKDDISGMVQSGFSLVNQIVDMCGTTSYPPISNTIMGTAVRVGKAGTFASYGGKYYGYGSTPDTRNAVVEVLVDPLTAWPHDHSKRNGGRAYIYDGDFYAGGGANVFNICRDKGEEEFTSVHYRRNTATKQLVPITYDEHYGVEELFYSNQDALDKGTLKDDGKIYDANGKEIVPQPITTANIQVRGGTFHCHYDVMNMAKLEAGSPELDEDYTSEPHFRKFPGTSGAVNLGVDSFGADLIRDGRIQIEDNSDGCLVLMDDQEEGYNGLYHYRLFCGDNELRTKAYLRVTPNNDAQTNSSYSMQLATYYGAGTRTNDLFKDDANGDNIRSPYRQMESYFDFQIDDTNHRSAYSVKPNFRVRQTDENDPKVLNKNEWDVYGENVASSEVWYYPAPLDKNGHQIGDVDYGYSQLTMFASESGLKKVVGTSQYNLTSKSGGAYHLYDKNLLDDDNWSDIISSASSLVVTSMNKVTYKTVRTNMKYFTYKVYQVDPLTRENLNANGCYGGDDPLLTVRYGCAPEETALRCKLPLDEVERRIKRIRPEWKGYRAGEMYRIVLEVEEQIGIGEKDAERADINFNAKFDDFGKKLRSAKTTTSILFRCFERNERYEAPGHEESLYLDTDFTPLQWTEYPTTMHTLPAGRKHTIELRNGKTGMTDWLADARVFDIYYQWWEVDEDGNPLKLLAGTDNVFDDGRSKYNELGTSKANYDKDIQAEIAQEKAASSTDDDTVYELKDKANHKPGGWKLKYVKKSDGKMYQYANTVDPDDPKAATYVNPDYPNVVGLPKIASDKECSWTAEQLHMFTSETTGTNDLKIDKGQNLTLYNNNMFANQTDSCYIPKEMIGKRIRVKAIALNVRWPLAFDKKQTFWSHTMEICDPNSPEGYLTIKTDENEEFGEDVPATFSIEKLRDFYDGSKISSVTYVAYGKYKTFTFSRDKVETNIAALPPVRYPKDFTDMTEREPGLWTDFYKDYHDYDGAFVAIGLTEDIILEQVRGDYYVPDMDVKYAVLKPAPKIGGWFTITPGKDYDPNKLDEEQSATFSITSLNGLNAGETISGVTYYAFGKQKVFSDLSIYDLKDLPDARYPVGFTDASHLNKQIALEKGDVWVKVTTSKGSEPYRTVYLREEKPQLKGTVNLTFDQDMNYATFNHPVTVSLDDFKGLAYNEEISEVHYKLLGSNAEKVFSKEDDPDVFKGGIPTAKFPNDFYGEHSMAKFINKTVSPYVTVVVTRREAKQNTEQQTSPRQSNQTNQKTKIKKIANDGDDGSRLENFLPANSASIQYVVEAESMVRRGAEVEQFKRSDILAGKYDSGIPAFEVSPPTAKIGYSYSDCTSSNEKVAVLDASSSAIAYIKLTGEPGEATFSMQSPDGETVTKTVRVVNDYDSVDISGIKAPVIGEKFDIESIKAPDDAPYQIKEVKWYKGSRLNEEVGADAVAEYFNSYTVGVTVEPKEYSEPASDVSYQLRVTKPDGTVDIVSPDWVEQAFDYENHLYLPSYTIQYTFPAQSDHAASVIDEIHIDFPTEIEEGTYWNDWVKNVHIYTNGYDEGFTFDIRQTFGPDAESIASALGYGLDTQKVTVFRFVKGIQNGIGAEIRIPDELKELGDVFADKITVYINGEESKTFGYYESGKVLIAASDTLKVTGNAAPEAMPGYTVKGANAVVGETININDLLVCDDPRVSIRIRDFGDFSNAADYLTYDLYEGTVKPVQKYWDGFSMNYIVSFDADKDGNPEYERSSYLYFSKIYADDSEIPEEKKVTDYGTARVTLLNPDGTEAGKADYPIRAGKNIPEVKNTFLAGTFDSGNKAVDPYFFENGMRYTVKTVSADEFEVYAGADTVYGFIKNQDGNDISGIQISIDGERFYAGDHITGLIPDTDYTLYYRQNADGTLYAKNFHTAKQDYGVYIGRRPVTDENPGDLEQDGWTYDPDKKVLTLKNFSIKDKGAVAKVVEYAGAAYSINAVISAQDELTVRLIGDNEIENLGDSTSSAVYAEKSMTIEGNGNLTVAKGGDGLKSNSSSIYLDGSGKLTFDKVLYGLTADKGIIEYTNGSIEFIPKLVTANNVNYYPTGSLVSESHKDSIKFTSSVHDLTVDAGKTEEEIAEISESELADVITNPYLTITPQHHDVNKAASAESYESGTCDKGCLYHLSCDCGHISEETFTAEAEEHVLVKHEAKSATCDQAGAPAYWECTHCGECYADAEGTKPLAEADLVIPALGHKLTHHAAKDATCDAAGVIEYWECSTCGERFADETAKFLLHDADLIVPKTAHEWVQVFSKAATCDTDGVSEHWECKNCGKFSADSEGKELLKKEDLVTPAFGHSWSAWTVVKEATQTAEGEEVRVCDVCGETENRAIEKLPIVTTTTTITTTTTTATTTSTTKATTTTAKATTTTTKATTTTTKATTTTTKATTTTTKATTTTTKATTTTTKATTTTTKATTTTTKATTTTTKATTTTTNATTTTTKATTTTTKATTTTTKATTTTTKDVTTTAKDVTAATTTTFTTESDMTIVTSVKYKIEIPDTKLNFCSNDSSSIMNCRGLKDLTASLTLYKFYVNESNQFVDANGAVLSDSEGNPLLYTEGQPIAADETAAFDVQESDIAGQIAPEEQFSTAAKIWESERKAQFGDDYQSWDTNFDAAAKQDISTNHANKYNVKLYFDPSKSENPACRISEEPVEIGEIRVFIGVKGDFNLNNKVDLRDLQGTLKYYTWSTVSRLEPEELVGALSADPELDGEDGLIYYLLNVVYRDGKTADSPVSETQKIALADQRALLKYYTYRYVSKLDPQDYSWEKIVGYDLENQ